MSVVITAKDVGVEFYTSRRRKMQVRDLLFHGRATTSTDTFWALKDISFEITRGEAGGLVGGNGSRQSTLLKAIAGVLLPHRGTVDGNGGGAPPLRAGPGGPRGLESRALTYIPISARTLPVDPSRKTAGLFRPHTQRLPRREAARHNKRRYL